MNSTITLSEWLAEARKAGAPVGGIKIEPGQPVPIPDPWCPFDLRAQLWNLSDYYVSSICAGTIWLIPA